MMRNGKEINQYIFGEKKIETHCNLLEQTTRKLANAEKFVGNVAKKGGKDRIPTGF